MFKNIIIAALLVGAITGALLGVLQIFTTSPIIMAAEAYEVSEASAADTHNGATQAHSHTHSHDDAGEAWAPSDGIERTTYTIFASMLTAVGFAMLVIAAMAYTQKIKPLHGLLFGLAGYLSFFVAPSLGLIPEIPGTLAANLEGRQGWWMMTVLLTAAGLACLAFMPKLFKLFGFALIAVPHVLGAPLPSQHGFANTDPQAVAALTELSGQFVIMTAITLLVFWVVLGVLSSYAAKKYL
ncbi:MAG: CbtA family protein [Hyphomicrobiales bacterium]